MEMFKYFLDVPKLMLSALELAIVERGGDLKKAEPVTHQDVTSHFFNFDREILVARGVIPITIASHSRPNMQSVVDTQTSRAENTVMPEHSYSSATVENLLVDCVPASDSVKPHIKLDSLSREGHIYVFRGSVGFDIREAPRKGITGRFGDVCVDYHMVGNAYARIIVGVNEEDNQWFAHERFPEPGMYNKPFLEALVSTVEEATGLKFESGEITEEIKAEYLAGFDCPLQRAEVKSNYPALWFYAEDESTGLQVAITKNPPNTTYPYYVAMALKDSADRDKIHDLTKQASATFGDSCCLLGQRNDTFEIPLYQSLANSENLAFSRDYGFQIAAYVKNVVDRVREAS